MVVCRKELKRVLLKVFRPRLLPLRRCPMPSPVRP
nr:MAG TPA_asm: hypothetical protein [Caudoviricetes sp.]